MAGEFVGINPWYVPETSNVQLGKPSCGLSLARRYGLYNDTKQQDVRAKIHFRFSFGMIGLFQEATQESSKVKHVDSELNMLIINKQEQDLVQHDSLEKSLKKVHFEQHHVTKLFNSWSQLLCRLQSRAVCSSFRIDPSYQTHTCGLLCGIEHGICQFPEVCLVVNLMTAKLTDASIDKQLTECACCIMNWRNNWSFLQQLQQLL